MLEAPHSLVFWLTLLGIFIAYLCYILIPSIPNFIVKHFNIIYRILMDKYGFDAFNDFVFVRGTKALGRMFYNVSDKKLIDGFFVNGTGRTVSWFATKGRLIQDGYLNHYIAVMVLGVFGFLCWLIL